MAAGAGLPPQTQMEYQHHLLRPLLVCECGWGGGGEGGEGKGGGRGDLVFRLPLFLVFYLCIQYYITQKNEYYCQHKQKPKNERGLRTRLSVNTHFFLVNSSSFMLSWTSWSLQVPHLAVEDSTIPPLYLFSNCPPQ